jgi:prepilin-type N-terminal cleavage/methylation domain-containing protein
MTSSFLLRPRARGFTLVEMLVAASVFSLVLLSLYGFSAFALRMVSRNLATNHTHEVVRISDLRLMRHLHEAGSAFRLVNFDGTTYTDVAPTATADTDTSTGLLVSTRANGVRFRRLGGGPYRLTASTTSSSTDLSFDFRTNGQVTYVPQVGDKFVIPVIAREFDISAVPTVPSSGSPVGTIRIADAGGLGFTLNATGAGNVTTGYFYPSAAFTVWNGSLRYHDDFSGARRANFNVVRRNITSPRPFALLFPTGGGSSDGLKLRVSLEAYDGAYSARLFSNGATTLQAVIPTRTAPTPISSTNSY